MKNTRGTAYIILLLLLLFSGGVYLFYKGTSWFIYSIDGDSANSNYIPLTKRYYLFKTERAICINSNDKYEEVITVTDSLNWDDSKIAGYSKSKYFTIDVTSGKINYFDLKDSLMKYIIRLPAKTLKEIPAMKQ